MILGTFASCNEFELQQDEDLDYEIIYNNVEGAVHDNPYSYTANDTFVLTGAEKDEYNFLGWFTDATLSIE